MPLGCPYMSTPLLPDILRAQAAAKPQPVLGSWVGVAGTPACACCISHISR